MNRQLVHRSALWRAFGEGPALERTRVGVKHILDVGTGQSGRKRHVERQIDYRVDGSRGSHGRCTVGSSEGLGGDIGMSSRHAERRRHSFPAMTGLAREVGDLVHGQGEPSL